MTQALCCQSNVSLSRHTPQWPAPRSIATYLLPERRDELALHAGWPRQEHTGDSLNLAATNPRTGGRPSQVLAGTNPTTGRPPSFLNPALANKPFLPRLFVQVPSRVWVRRRSGGRDDGYAERVLPYGRRPNQPSSSPLARRSCVHFRFSRLSSCSC